MDLGRKKKERSGPFSFAGEMRHGKKGKGSERAPTFAIERGREKK